MRKPAPRRSLTARITAEEELKRQLEEDAELTRPTHPLMSQAGPSALALHQGEMNRWRKAKAVELARRQRELDRAQRPAANVLEEFLTPRR